MNNKNQQEQLHKCPACGLMYKDKEYAEKCEAWCTKYQSCNLDIIQHAENNSN